jgi:hypothetical protein
VLSVAKRDEPEWHYIDAMEQIRAESTRLDGFSQLDVGGADHAHTPDPFFATADWRKGSIIKQL